MKTGSYDFRWLGHRMRLGRIVDVSSLFSQSQKGTTATLVAIALPVMLGAFGGAVDYAALSNAKSRASTLAEGAALSVGREMTLGALSSATVQDLASRYVTANIGADAAMLKSVSGQLIVAGNRVRVDVVLAAQLPVGVLSQFVDGSSVFGSAVAKVGQQQKLCALSLAEVQLKSDAVASKSFATSTQKVTSKDVTGLDLRPGSRLTAMGCVVHSNLSTNTAIRVGSGAIFKGDVICAVGKVQNNGGSITGDTISNCPKLPDPLAERPYPRMNGACLPTGKVTLSSGTHTLRPGTYCEDVKISGTAQVQLLPGSYVFKRRLEVDKNAELRGSSIGLFFSGKDSFFKFNDNALIDLTAPSSGEMAGMLIWEGMDLASIDEKTLFGDFHQINSDRARRLTGTIYLPAGHLLVDSKKAVAEASEFTVLVASRVTIGDGPNLVLNTNYSGTTVPVPAGLGPLGAKDVRLESSN